MWCRENLKSYIIIVPSFGKGHQMTSYRANITESKKEKILTVSANLNCHNEDIITSCFEWLTVLRKNNQMFISETGLFICHSSCTRFGEEYI
jgi:hypothetical protein